MGVVGEASGAEEAVARAAGTRPEVALTDSRVPGTDGITAIGRILAEAAASPPGPGARAERPSPPRVPVLSTLDPGAYVYAALRAGASGFLPEDTGPERPLGRPAPSRAGTCSPRRA
ncbi:response regulator transcription factor [Streptomyces caelestis]|uniref:response regulator n=1 Tax=Streptomyces caelestis TaxID=36816 RepID=UPI003656CB6F